MKKNLLYSHGVLKVGFVLFLLLGSTLSFCQSQNNGQRGIFESYAILSINGAANTYYDLYATTGNADFNTANLGSFCTNQSIVFKGGEQKTYKNSGCNVTNSDIFYRVWSGTPSGSYTQVNLPFNSNIGGGGDQKWDFTSGTTNILSGLSPGNYTIEVYTRAQFNSCGFGDIFTNNSNSGTNYRATFTVVAPAYAGTNGSLTICSGSTVTAPQLFAQLGNSLKVAEVGLQH